MAFGIAASSCSGTTILSTCGLSVSVAVVSLTQAPPISDLSSSTS